MEIKLTREEFSAILLAHLPLAPALVQGKRLVNVNYGASYERTVILTFENEDAPVERAPSLINVETVEAPPTANDVVL